MKKYFIFLFCGMLLLVTGCGKDNSVTCSKSETEDGVTMTESVTLKYDSSNKITGGSMEYDFGNEEYANMFCSILKLGADTDIIKCEGTKIYISDIDAFESDEDEEESEKLVGQDKDEFVKKAKEEGYTCK